MTINELQHHGILGQKWGIRRYQNKDGTYTAAGKRRLNGQVKFDENGNPDDADKAHNQIHQAVASDYTNLSKASNAASNAARTASGMASRSAKKDIEKRKAEIDVSEMSDQELQKAINRMNLERNYKNLKAEQISSGKLYASDVLQTAGDVLAIGASMASIASAIYLMRK